MPHTSQDLYLTLSAMLSHNQALYGSISYLCCLPNGTAEQAMLGTGERVDLPEVGGCAGGVRPMHNCWLYHPPANNCYIHGYPSKSLTNAGRASGGKELCHIAGGESWEQKMDLDVTDATGSDKWWPITSIPTPVDCCCRVVEDWSTQVAALLPHSCMLLVSYGGGVWLVLWWRVSGCDL